MNGDFVTVKTFLSLHEAEQARSLLEVNGIEVEISTDECCDTDGLIGGGIELMVAAEDVERAIRILDEFSES